jgi:tRNA1Val (adenine37-N6)-methyltransferase
VSEIFQLKQFIIQQDKSAMKVGTDSLLLGCFTEINGASTILDIGTGTGILALMMAQKSSAKIDAVELDEGAFEEATLNFKASKWSNKIKAYHTSIQQFESKISYDLIISNPPFYVEENNIKITNSKRAKARQDKDLPFDSLCEEVMKRLSDKGKFWLILPTDEAEEFLAIAKKAKLFLQGEILIKPKPSKSINRIVMCFGKTKSEMYSDIFTVYDDAGTSTEDYYELTKEFLLWKRR